MIDFRKDLYGNVYGGKYQKYRYSEAINAFPIVLLVSKIENN